MMHLSSFLSLLFRFFVLYLCILTLAISSSSSGTFINSALLADHIECPGSLPDDVLYHFSPPPRTLLQLCAARELLEFNMKCTCLDNVLLCGTSRNPLVRELVEYCLNHCLCGPETEVIRHTSTEDIQFGSSESSLSSGSSFSSLSSQGSAESTGKKPSSPVRNPTGATHTCEGTCTSVTHGCASQSTRDCTCLAPPVSLFYWHLGDCGTRLPSKAKRDLAPQRHSYYLNATLRFASSNKATTPAGPLPDHAAQLASGLLPSPCNASYVSFACADSTDGIVHEPPENWLGALLPKGTKKAPPVPKKFLSIHGIEEGKLQVAMAAVD